MIMIRAIPSKSRAPYNSLYCIEQHKMRNRILMSKNDS